MIILNKGYITEYRLFKNKYIVINQQKCEQDECFDSSAP